MGFQKATKTKVKLRGAIFGPSGSGKTKTGLLILKGMGCENIAVIDSERSSAERYADDFDFDTVNLETKKVDEYIKYINEAKKAGYNGLLIDSISHGWQQILETVDKLAHQKYNGNSFRAWSEGTPLQKKFIDTLLDFDGHLIVTMRSKTEWLVEKDERTGKQKPVRVGLAPEQGKGIEYEFDFLIEMSPNHVATVIKDRTDCFQDAIIEKPGLEFGAKLSEWLATGVDKPKPLPPKKVYTEGEVKKFILEKVMTADSAEKWKEIQGWLQSQEWFEANTGISVQIFSEAYTNWKGSFKNESAEIEKQ